MIRYQLVYLAPLIIILIFLPLEDIESTRYLDLGAVMLPLAYSAVTGFYDVSLIIIQRMIFALAGLGLVLGASLIWELRRRSNTSKEIALISIFIILFFSFSAGFAWLDQKPLKDGKLLRAKLREHHNTHVNSSQISVDSCDLTIVHEENKINVKARLSISNPNNSPIESFMLSLNPGFEVYDVIPSPSPAKANIILEKPLNSSESIEIEIAYRGSVNQDATYLHIPEDFRERNRRSGLNVLGKQTAFIEPDFVMLPAEVNWYPTALSSYKVKEPGYLQRPLTNFSLDVKTREGLTVISQGQKEITSNNNYLFTPEMPITQISL
ncbi:hypothetical protein ACFL6K_06950, partial [Candidatus Latescibacterota bacterium]